MIAWIRLKKHNHAGFGIDSDAWECYVLVLVQRERVFIWAQVAVKLAVFIFPSLHIVLPTTQREDHHFRVADKSRGGG